MYRYYIQYINKTHTQIDIPIRYINTTQQTSTKHARISCLPTWLGATRTPSPNATGWLSLSGSFCFFFDAHDLIMNRKQRLQATFFES